MDDPRSGSRATGPIIGRESERVLLHEEITLAIQGEGRLVIISGEAGIGKTTLALDVLAEGRQRGALTLTGYCHQLTSTPPYAPWLDLATSVAALPHAPPYPAALANGYLTDFRSQTELFAETIEFLTELSQARPVIILLEDMHWSDSTSLELLRFLCTRLSALPVLMVMTYRLDELTRTLPLYHQLPGLARSGKGLRLHLRRIDSQATTQLVRSRHNLEGDDERRLVDYLEQHAQGNPLFATELILALEDAGVLSHLNGTSQFDVLDHIVLPPLLTQLIDTRVSRLGESAREPLTMAAIIGEDVRLDLWAKIAYLEPDAFLALIEQAVEAHLLIASRDGRSVRFNHALTRDALYESILPSRRHRWHRLIADQLMADPTPDPDAVAHHLGQAGDDRAGEWMIQAGNRAQRAYAWLIAAERFTEAANAMAALDGTQRERGWLLLRAARLMRLAYPERGLGLLRQARQLADDANDPLLAADARYSTGLLMGYANQVHTGVDEVTGGILELEQRLPDALRGDATVAFALADSLPRREGWADTELESSIALQRASGMNHRRGGISWWRALVGDPQVSIANGLKFNEAVAQLESPGGLVIASSGHALLGMGIAYAQLGLPDESAAAFGAARETYRKLDHHGLSSLANLFEIQNVALVYGADDATTNARLMAEAIRATDQASGAMPPGFSATIVVLPYLVLNGAWDEAMEVITESPPLENTFYRHVLSETAALIAMHRGQFDEAWSHVHDALPRGPSQPWGSKLFREALSFQRIATELALLTGDQDLAVEWLEAHDSWLAKSGVTLGMADAQSLRARHFLATGDISAAASVATNALNTALHPRQPLAILSVHRVLGEIESRRGNAPEASTHFEAALGLADQCRAPFEQARVLTSFAEHDHHTGNTAEAATRARQAAALAQPLHADPILKRLAAISTDAADSLAEARPFGLTAREIDVLILVAQGLTDANVAAQLFISPRTVGQHLRSIYNKIDVSSRSAATRFAIEHNLA